MTEWIFIRAFYRWGEGVNIIKYPSFEAPSEEVALARGEILYPHESRPYDSIETCVVSSLDFSE